MYTVKKVQESTSHAAYLYAVRLLSKKDYSQIKITQKLKDRGYDSDHVESAINQIIQLGYLREDNYIEGRIKSFMLKGWSKEHIQQKLKQESLDVPYEEIEKVFEEYEYSEESQILFLIKKKIPFNKSFLEDEDKLQKTKNKILNYLISKGHCYHECKPEVDKAMNELKNQL